MNGIDKITGRILAETEEEIASIRARAEAECQEIALAYDIQAEDQYWKLATAGRRAADQKAERMQSMAAMESKKHVLALKQSLVDEAFNQAIQRFLDLPEDEYVALLATLAVKAVKTGREQLIFSAKDRGLYGKKVTIRANEMLSTKGHEAALTMSEDTREIIGGVIVTDGLVDVNCSFEAMVETQKATLTGQIVEILFD